MKIQANIGGFMGDMITVMASYDERTGIVSFPERKRTEYSPERRAPDVALVTNMRLDSYDSFFDTSKMGEAIAHYFVRKAQGTITMHPSLARFAPDNQIQAKAVGEGGQYYEISPDVSNGQMAVLAVCAYVDAAASHSAATDAWDELYGGFSV